ncbi:ABC transporter permease [Psychrosphaera sp.]|nr:ABC transporter permease [Psychrosphaera sp.]
MNTKNSLNFKQSWTVAKWEFLHFFKLKQEVIGKLIMLAAGLVIYFVANKSQQLDDVYKIATAQSFEVNQDLPNATSFEFIEVDNLQEVVTGLTQESVFDAALEFHESNSTLLGEQMVNASLTTAEKSAWQNQLITLINAEMQMAKFEQLNLTSEQQVALSTPINIDHKVLDDLLKNEADKTQTLTAYGVLFLLVVAVFGVFGQLFVSITGEKQNRVTEQLMATMTPQTWIDGKLLGQILFAVKTMIGTLLSIVISFLFFSVVIKHQSLDLNIINWSLLPWLFAFAIAGLSICAAFMAAIASAIDDPNHSGKSGLMMLPLVPVVLTFFLIDSPNSVITVFLSYLPVTSFAVMPVRMSLVELPIWEPILSLILSFACFYYFRILAARVFKMGMNMYGKEPTLKDMLKATYKG